MHLTCTNKRVKDQVILFHFCMISHNERESSIHTSVSYKVPVLHTMGADQLSLSICYLKDKKVRYNYTLKILGSGFTVLQFPTQRPK